jgi:hypothetical protein
MLSRLNTMVLLLVFAAASWAAFGAFAGTGLLTMLLAAAVYVRAGSSRWSLPVRIAVVVLGLLASVGLLAPAIATARNAARGFMCENYLKQIAVALRTYRDVNGSFPPACSYDREGRPLHSWRLLIKPYLDASVTYDSCHRSEPWNSPYNKEVLAVHPSSFCCPADPAAWDVKWTTTSYLAVVGRTAAWRFHGEAIPESHDSFLVLEVPNSGIHWAEPRDINFDDLAALQSLAVHGPHLRDNGYFYHQTPAINAVLVVGDMIFAFPWNREPSVVDGLLPSQRRHLNHNKSTYDALNELYQEEPPTHWPHRAGLPLWIATGGLLAHQVARRHNRIFAY